MLLTFPLLVVLQRMARHPDAIEQATRPDTRSIRNRWRGAGALMRVG